MVSGIAARSVGIALSLSLLCLAVAAQEQEDVSIKVTKTATGAVLEEKIGVDGLLVSESFLLTRLTCRINDYTIDVLMPFSREDMAGKQGSTFEQGEGQSSLAFHYKTGAQRRRLIFVPIADSASLLQEAAQVTIAHDSSFWRALIAKQGYKLVAMTGGQGVHVSVTNGTELHQFEKTCGLKR